MTGLVYPAVRGRQRLEDGSRLAEDEMGESMGVLTSRLIHVGAVRLPGW